MSGLVWLTAVLAGLFLLYGWYHDHHLMPKRQAKQLAEAEEHRTSDEYVIQQQMKFEKRLQEGIAIGSPDAVRGRAAHIYLYLMREWFNTLAAKSRYDEVKVRKIRRDWLIYMDGLEMSRMSRFLSLEGPDEASRERHERDAREEMLKLAAIEDAFAEAVVPEAVEKLRQIRAKEWDSFNDAGVLAPDGYRYRGFSIGGVPDEPIPRS